MLKSLFATMLLLSLVGKSLSAQSGRIAVQVATGLSGAIPIGKDIRAARDYYRSQYDQTTPFSRFDGDFIPRPGIVLSVLPSFRINDKWSAGLALHYAQRGFWQREAITLHNSTEQRDEYYRDLLRASVETVDLGIRGSYQFKNGWWMSAGFVSANTINRKNPGRTVRRVTVDRLVNGKPYGDNGRTKDKIKMDWDWNKRFLGGSFGLAHDLNERWSVGTEWVWTGALFQNMENPVTNLLFRFTVSKRIST